MGVIAFTGKEMLFRNKGAFLSNETGLNSDCAKKFDIFRVKEEHIKKKVDLLAFRDLPKNKQKNRSIS